MTTGYRYAMQQWVTDGVRVNYDINFDGGYLHSADVIAYREPFDGTSATGPQESLAVSFVVDNGADGATATVRVGATPTVPQPVGYRVTILRSTEKGAPLVDFQNGAVLTGDNLDLMTKQTVFAVAELTDQFSNLDANVTANLTDYDDRIAANTAAVAAAQDTADGAVTTANNAATLAATANATANTAKATADATAAQLADAITAANNATTAANNATDALTGIEDAVNSAVDEANNAVTVANAASANANALSDLIDSANTNATNALNTANAIDAKAQSALDTANSAASDASTALSTANAAQSAVSAQATSDAATYMPKAGGAFSGGVNWGAVVGANAQDTSKHITLHTNGYGWGVTSNSFNNVAPTGAAHNWYVGATALLSMSNTAFTYKGNGIWHSGNFTPGNYALLSGATFTGDVSLSAGLSCGTTLATGVDLSKQIMLYSTNYGFNVITGKIQVVHAGVARASWTSSGYDVAGSCTATGGFQSTSSRRVKTKLRPIRNALKTVDALELVTGQYKRDFCNDGRRHYFAIAEQAEMHAPPLVTQNAGEYKGEKVKGFDYDGLSVLNSAAIQELLRIVQDQQRQINELKEMYE